MIHLTLQERKVLLFLLFLFLLGLTRSIFIKTKTAEGGFNGYTCVAAPDLKAVDINQANRRQLMLLPGVGEKTADEIIRYRQERGAFQSIEELKKVKGIGGKKLEKMRGRITLKESDV